MTKSEHIKAVWHRVDLYVINVLVVLLAGAVGAAIMNWLNSIERMQLIDRFPTVRAEERASCVREFKGKIDDLTRLNEQGARSLEDLRTQMSDTHEITAYMLRYLGDRAKVTDARTAAMLKQTRAAAAAANAAQQTSVQVEQKVAVAASKAGEAASTAQAVSKKLDTAVHPPQPAKPWAGAR